MGFPVGKTICIQCSHHENCLKNGYLAETIRARKATVSLATHQRVARTGLEELIERRLFVGIHENPLPVLRPEVGISAQDLRIAQEFVQTLVSEPFYHNYFSDGTRINELG